MEINNEQVPDFRKWLEGIIPFLRSWYQNHKEIQNYFDSEKEFINSFLDPIIASYNADKSSLNPEQMKKIWDAYFNTIN